MVPHCQVGQNITEVSYHASQYRHIISDLRNEIARLRAKMEVRPDGEGVDKGALGCGAPAPTARASRGSGDGSVNGNDRLFDGLVDRDPDLVTGTPTCRTHDDDDGDEHFKAIKDEIVSTFREQMRLRCLHISL